VSNRILYVQYTNPAGYPPLEHSSRILADRGWRVLFLGTGAHGADALQFPPHPNIEVRRWKFVRAGLWQKLHFLAFNDWALITALRWKPKWIYASDLFSCPVALLLKRIGFRVLYHEHDSPGTDVGRSPRRIRPLADRKSDVSRLRPAVGGTRASQGGQKSVVGSQWSVVTDRWSAFQRFLLWSRKKLARCADLCVLPNEKRVEFFKEQTATSRPVICVWNCPAREEAEVQPTKASDEFVVFYHGSIVPDRLPISVVRALADSPSSVRLRIAGYETVGHPGYVRELEEFAHSLGLRSRFEYLGSFSRKALLPETRKAHIGLALMPINAKDLNLQAMTGASNKPFEYMACGLALLVSDLPDWNQMFVKPGSGRTCDPSDPNGIAGALHWFFEHQNETRMMGERGRQRIFQDWNYEIQFAPVLEKLEAS